jgi:hypothetical protein
MRTFFTATTIVLTFATSAAADDLGRLGNRQQHGRAFWLSNQAWPNPQDQAPGQPKPKFTMTYTDGVAERLHLDGSRDLFAQKLGGEGGPALVGTMDHGAALLALRWRMGE